MLKNKSSYELLFLYKKTEMFISKKGEEIMAKDKPAHQVMTEKVEEIVRLLGMNRGSPHEHELLRTHLFLTRTFLEESALPHGQIGVVIRLVQAETRLGPKYKDLLPKAFLDIMNLKKGVAIFIHCLKTCASPYMGNPVHLIPKTEETIIRAAMEQDDIVKESFITILQESPSETLKRKVQQFMPASV